MFSGSSAAAGIDAPSTSTGTTSTFGPRERRGDLEPHEVVRFVEPPVAGHVAGADPLAPDDGQHDAAVVEARLDRLHEVLSGAQGIDVAEHP